MNEDFHVFQEEDGSAAYIVVRHLGFFCIEQLDDDFYGGLGKEAAKVVHVPMGCSYGSPVTRAQQRDVFRVESGGLVWVGINYIPGSGGAGTCTNAGLIYWWPLEFDERNISQMEWNATVSFQV
jgi:hypothetical protein